MKKLKVIITGATGMVGEGVLLECLQNDHIAEILIINRRPSGYTHAKLTEIIHSNFHDLTPIANQLNSYDACYFCLGVSSVGMNETNYTHITYNLTLHVATTLAAQNPAMTFCYVSGAGTDSSENGRSMWARVKGRTENDLQKLPFRAVYLFRPAMLIASPGQKYLLPVYKWLSWSVPIMKLVVPQYICSLKELGLAMIHVTLQGYFKPVLEVKDIKLLAAQQ